MLDPRPTFRSRLRAALHGLALTALLGGAATAQDARYDIPQQTTSAAPQTYRPLSIDVPRVPRPAVDRMAPRHGRRPVPEGSGGLPLPQSAPTRVATAPIGGPVASSPGDFRIFSSQSVVQPGFTPNWPPEPQVVVERDAVLYTHNSGAVISGDSGGSWGRLAPELLFPASDGGFCCDQRLVRSHASPNLSVWLLQYWYSGTTQTGRHRIAIARNRDDLKNSSYYFYDLTPQMFGFAAGLWFDFPDLACSHGFLYGSANVYRGSDNANMGSVLWRISLAQLDAGGNVGIGFYTNAQLGSELYRLTQLAQDTMYAAADWTTTSLRFYWWPDNGNLSFENKNIATVSFASASAPGPDGRDWAGFCDHRILGAYFYNGEVGFLHSSAPVAGRPRAFVRASIFSGFSRNLLSEQDIWSNDFAVLYPAVSRNGSGDKAVVMAIGGGAYHPSTVAMIVDGYATRFDGNALFYLSAGGSGPASNRWGDYIGVTLHPSYLNTWVAPAHSQTGPSMFSIDHRFVWFGRELNTPYSVEVQVSASDVANTTAIQPPIQVAQVDRSGASDGFAPFVRRYAIRSAVTVTAPSNWTDGAGTQYRFRHWNQNGGNLAPGQQTVAIADIGVNAPTQLRAVYERLRVVNVQSFPMSGVSVSVDVQDLNGQWGGLTPFQLTYVEGQRITLSTPGQWGNSFFSHWTLDGVRRPPTILDLVLDVTANHNAVSEFGGIVGNGPDWSDLTGLSATEPPARSGHAMTFDSATGQAILFGGTNGTAFGDTWALYDSTWTQLAPTNAPSPRSGHAMAYDVVNARTLLFGGGGSSLASSRNDETWAFDGVDWTQLAPTASPPARTDAVMAWDQSSSTALLFGGRDANGFFGVGLNDTWVFDGTTWTELFPATVPPVFDYASMDYDVYRARVVLLGYSTSTGTLVFEWNGLDWTDVTPATLPANRSSTITYDLLRSRMVLFSGRQGIGMAPADTWEYDGVQCRERLTAAVPPARTGGAIVYDVWRQRCILFGGFSAPFTTRGDTWQYRYSCDVIGEGHPGGGASLVCTAPPQIGQTFCFEFPSSIGGGYAVFGFGYPARPAVQLDPPITCQTGFLHPNPDIIEAAPGIPATMCLTIPADPALVGAVMTVQGMDLSAALCLNLTDAIVIVIQP